MGRTLLDIGEVSRRSGLPASALRFYESRGLIQPAGRRGLRRAYEPGVLDRLAIIVALQDAGFGLAELEACLDAAGEGAELRRKLVAKVDELEERIAQLSSMRDRLRHVLKCRSPRILDCPTFLRDVRSVLPRRDGPRGPSKPAQGGRARAPRGRGGAS